MTKRAAIAALLLLAGCGDAAIDQAKARIHFEARDASVIAAEAHAGGLVCGWLDRGDGRRQRFAYRPDTDRPLARDLTTEIAVQQRNRRALDCGTNPVPVCASDLLATTLAEQRRFSALWATCGGMKAPA